MLRTRTAGSLRTGDTGTTVTLTGWVGRRRDHGGVAFLDLRDASGVAQVVVRDEQVAHGLRNEYCLRVTGQVQARPAGNENPNLPTGEIEVVADELEVLNAAAPLPFQIDDHVDVGEEARLRHRYLDLRRTGPGNALRLRSKVNRAAREVLDAHEFVEIETPTLTRSTPEGARDFLVPARLAPGSWYALPQSPQLFKQLLMVAGMERYYQIARCYRDEDFRADRQPEFTQLDIEMSFVDQDDVIALAEEVLVALWKLVDVELTTPFARMTYAEAMARYGTDKPDLRFGLELVECTEYFSGTGFRVFQAPYVGAVVMPGGASQPRRQFDAWQEWAKQRGARGLAYVTVGEDGTLGGPVAKNLSEDELAGLAAHTGATPGDCIFFAAGEPKSSRALLGAARVEIARRGESSTRTPGRSSGSSTRRCSSRRPTPSRPVTSRSAPAPGPRCTTPSRRRSRSGSTGSRSRPARRSPTPTTSSATATRSAAGPSVSTAATCRSGSSRSWAWRRRRRRRSSVSCSTRSRSGRPRTVASPSAGTGSSRCWPAPTRSAR